MKREFLNLTKMYASYQNSHDEVFRFSGLQKCGGDADGDDETAGISRRDRPMRRFFGKIMLCRRRGYLKIAVN